MCQMKERTMSKEPWDSAWWRTQPSSHSEPQPWFVTEFGYFRKNWHPEGRGHSSRDCTSRTPIFRENFPYSQQLQGRQMGKHSVLDFWECSIDQAPTGKRATKGGLRFFKKCWAGWAIGLIFHLYFKLFHSGRRLKTMGQGLLRGRSEQSQAMFQWIESIWKLVWITETITISLAPSTDVISASSTQSPCFLFLTTGAPGCKWIVTSPLPMILFV